MAAASLTFDLRPVTHGISDAEREALVGNPGFGKVFTEHMVSIRYAEGKGWHDPELVPHGPINLDPAAAALHYGQEIFEGLKAYYADDGSIVLFRPERNAQRFNRSAARLAMPALPEELFLESIRVLVTQEQAWVPRELEASLYLRPLMFATDAFLGVKPANEYLFLLIASPVGAYFPSGVKPVSVWLSTDYTRAAPGGTGEAKCAGNYGASLVAQAQAAERGCEQVVWLDAVEHRWVEEMGGMNLFFVFTDAQGIPTVTTPSLTGTLLPGITRDSILQLAPDLGYQVMERRVSTDELATAAAQGRLTEVFACGTAAVITPVGTVKNSTGEYTIADGQPGPITMQLRQTILEIQHGRIPDPYGWVYPLLPATTLSVR